MKRLFTSSVAILVLLTTSTRLLAQTCLTGGSFTASASYTFDVVAQGFTGDFSWAASGSGQLESTPVSSGQTKLLTSPTLFLPASATTIAWSFDLGGSANVGSYSVVALYNGGSGPTSVGICSGSALLTTGGTLVFAAVAPAEIIGTNFQLQITFNSPSVGAKVLAIDNFKSNATAVSGGGSITLPVTFSYFNAAAGTGGIKLTWLVASELNVNRYEVERSGNGKTYTKIGQVAASGVTSYTYLDAAYSTGSNYYRVKAVDNDGTYKYSSVSLFKVGKSTLLSTLKIYPVPAKSVLTLTHDAAGISSSISILSSDGRLIKTIKPVAGNTETAIDISTMKAGLYLIRYSASANESITTKLIKE